MGLLNYIDLELFFALAFVQRSLAMQKLINHDSKGPDISFGPVVVV